MFSCRRRAQISPSNSSRDWQPLWLDRAPSGTNIQGSMCPETKPLVCVSDIHPLVHTALNICTVGAPSSRSSFCPLKLFDRLPASGLNRAAKRLACKGPYGSAMPFYGLCPCTQACPGYLYVHKIKALTIVSLWGKITKGPINGHSNFVQWKCSCYKFIKTRSKKNKNETVVHSNQSGFICQSMEKLY